MSGHITTPTTLANSISTPSGKYMLSDMEIVEHASHTYKLVDFTKYSIKDIIVLKKRLIRDNDADIMSDKDVLNCEKELGVAEYQGMKKFTGDVRATRSGKKYILYVNDDPKQCTMDDGTAKMTGFRIPASQNIQATVVNQGFLLNKIEANKIVKQHHSFKRPGSYNDHILLSINPAIAPQLDQLSLGTHQPKTGKTHLEGLGGSIAITDSQEWVKIKNVGLGELKVINGEQLGKAGLKIITIVPDNYKIAKGVEGYMTVSDYKSTYMETYAKKTTFKILDNSKAKARLEDKIKELKRLGYTEETRGLLHNKNTPRKRTANAIGYYVELKRPVDLLHRLRADKIDGIKLLTHDVVKKGNFSRFIIPQIIIFEHGIPKIINLLKTSPFYKMKMFAKTATAYIKNMDIDDLKSELLKDNVNKQYADRIIEERIRSTVAATQARDAPPTSKPKPISKLGIHENVFKPVSTNWTSGKIDGLGFNVENFSTRHAYATDNTTLILTEKPIPAKGEIKNLNNYTVDIPGDLNKYGQNNKLDFADALTPGPKQKGAIQAITSTAMEGQYGFAMIVEVTPNGEHVKIINIGAPDEMLVRKPGSALGKLAGRSMKFLDYFYRSEYLRLAKSIQVGMQTAEGVYMNQLFWERVIKNNWLTYYDDAFGYGNSVYGPAEKRIDDLVLSEMEETITIKKNSKAIDSTKPFRQLNIMPAAQSKFQGQIKPMWTPLGQFPGVGYIYTQEMYNRLKVYGTPFHNNEFIIPLSAGKDFIHNGTDTGDDQYTKRQYAIETKEPKFQLTSKRIQTEINELVLLANAAGGVENLDIDDFKSKRNLWQYEFEEILNAMNEAFPVGEDDGKPVRRKPKEFKGKQHGFEISRIDNGHGSVDIVVSREKITSGLDIEALMGQLETPTKSTNKSFFAVTYTASNGEFEIRGILGSEHRSDAAKMLEALMSTPESKKMKIFNASNVLSQNGVLFWDSVVRRLIRLKGLHPAINDKLVIYDVDLQIQPERTAVGKDARYFLGSSSAAGVIEHSGFEVTADGVYQAKETPIKKVNLQEIALRILNYDTPFWRADIGKPLKILKQYLSREKIFTLFLGRHSREVISNWFDNISTRINNNGVRVVLEVIVPKRRITTPRSYKPPIKANAKTKLWERVTIDGLEYIQFYTREGRKLISIKMPNKSYKSRWLAQDIGIGQYAKESISNIASTIKNQLERYKEIIKTFRDRGKTIPAGFEAWVKHHLDKINGHVIAFKKGGSAKVIELTKVKFKKFLIGMGLLIPGLFGVAVGSVAGFMATGTMMLAGASFYSIAWQDRKDRKIWDKNNPQGPKRWTSYDENEWQRMDWMTGLVYTSKFFSGGWRSGVEVWEDAFGWVGNSTRDMFRSLDQSDIFKGMLTDGLNGIGESIVENDTLTFSGRTALWGMNYISDVFDRGEMNVRHIYAGVPALWNYMVNDEMDALITLNLEQKKEIRERAVASIEREQILFDNVYKRTDDSNIELTLVPN